MCLVFYTVFWCVVMRCSVLRCDAVCYSSLSRIHEYSYCKCVYLYVCGVAMISKLLKNIGLFCRISSLLKGSFAKETYVFREPTNRSHLILRMCKFLIMQVQPIAFGVAFTINLQSQSHWSLFNRTWQKRPRELDYRLRFEIEEMVLQMQ